MKSFQKIARLSAVAAAAAVAAPAFAAASIDANAEFDTYVLKKSGSKSSGLQGTGPVSNRIEVNVAGRTEAGDMFLAGKGTVGITAAGGTYVDDAWVQLGTKTVDLKLGRFEAANLYPTGVDATRVFAFNTTGSGSFAVPASDGTALYQANALRGRARFVSDNTVDRFHGAVTANLGSGLSLEVGYVGKQAPTTAAPAVNGYSGARPVLTYASRVT